MYIVSVFILLICILVDVVFLSLLERIDLALKIAPVIVFFSHHITIPS